MGLLFLNYFKIHQKSYLLEKLDIVSIPESNLSRECYLLADIRLGSGRRGVKSESLEIKVYPGGH